MQLILDSFRDIANVFSQMWGVVSAIWFLIFPPMLGFLFKILWLDHVRLKWKMSIQWVVLEVIPPRNIEKSPQPMESFFVSLAGVLKTFNALEEYLVGEMTPFFSMEIISKEGTVHFMMRVPRTFRNLVEANLYAQYPDIQIIEMPDYVEELPRIMPNKDWTLWGVDFELQRDDAYPIRTYRFFQETVTGEMIDPLSAVIEVMGKLGPGQHLWLQFVAIPLKEDWYDKEGRKLVQELAQRVKKKESIGKRVVEDFTDVIKNIPKAMSEPVDMTRKEEKVEQAPLEFRLTPVEKEVLKAVESNIGKYVFKTKMRMVYLAKKEAFQKSLGVSAFVGAIKQFADFNLNSLKPEERSKTFANYNFFKHSRLRYRQRKIFRRYKDRDPDGAKFVLSSEELATVYHLPDKSVLSPAIAHVDARRSGAPSNLPV